MTRIHSRLRAMFSHYGSSFDQGLPLLGRAFLIHTKYVVNTHGTAKSTFVFRSRGLIVAIPRVSSSPEIHVRKSYLSVTNRVCSSHTHCE